QRVEQLVHGGERRLDVADDALAVLGAHAIAQLRDEQAQRMQRLPQIMARGREKAGFGLVGELELARTFLDLALERRVGLLQLRRHAVESLAERFELVAG